MRGACAGTRRKACLYDLRSILDVHCAHLAASAGNDSFTTGDEVGDGSRPMKERGVGKPWTQHEDSLLTQAVAVYGENDNWKNVAACVPGRTNKACRKASAWACLPRMRRVDPLFVSDGFTRCVRPSRKPHGQRTRTSCCSVSTPSMGLSGL